MTYSLALRRWLFRPAFSWGSIGSVGADGSHEGRTLHAIKKETASTPMVGCSLLWFVG